MSYIYYMHSSPQSSALFENASMGIIVVSSKGIIESINAFSLTLFGYTEQEVIRRSIELLIPFNTKTC